jgi:hypothetical protein
MLQVEQLVEPQLAQELPLPEIGTGIPFLLTETQQILDTTRSADSRHFGHSAGSSAWLKGRSNSNFESHAEHTYSYIGIFISPVSSLSIN